MCENPFKVFSPENLKPEMFKEIFVKETTWIKAIETPKDFIIIGSRGSGKSMYLNYLELEHQLYYHNNNLDEFIDPKRKNKYIGIMVHTNNHGLNTDRYEMLCSILSENYSNLEFFYKQLASHELIMIIMYRTLRTLIQNDIFSDFINRIKEELCSEFCKVFIDLLDKRKIHSDIKIQGENIKKLKILSEIFIDEIKNISYYCNDIFQAKNVEYNGNFVDNNYLSRFYRELKEFLKLEEFSFHILIDNAEEIRETLQYSVMELVKLRQHRDFCLKIAMQKGAGWDLSGIDDPHDYTSIDINELYSSLNSAYYPRIKEIANIRLNLVGYELGIDEFLPEDINEKNRLNEIKEELKKKYEDQYITLQESKKKGHLPDKKKYIDNLTNKYAMVKLFRNLGRQKKSFAGFHNIVHLSSGIVRQFLDICSIMHETQDKKDINNHYVKHIPLKTQQEVLKKYADDFLEKNVKIYNIGTFNPASEKFLKLYRLIDALGNYYKWRLMKSQYMDSRIYSFTVKDMDESGEIYQLLNLGVIHNCFHNYWYSSKTGIGRVRGYSFNRILCVRYGLDPTSFRGRIELKTASLIKAANEGKLDRDVIKKQKNHKSLDEFEGV